VYTATYQRESASFFFGSSNPFQKQTKDIFIPKEEKEEF